MDLGQKRYKSNELHENYYQPTGVKLFEIPRTILDPIRRDI